MKRKILMMLVGVSCATMGSVEAQESRQGFYAVPGIGVSSIHDDNIFFSIDEEQSDTALRVSPELEVGYESQRTSMQARYSFDSEKYEKFTTLDSDSVRTFADFQGTHQLTRRFALEGEVHYTETNTPADITLGTGSAVPGLFVGRAQAERLAIQPAVTFQMTPTWGTRLGYSHTNDKLADALESETQIVESEFGWQRSAKTLIEYGYTYRQYDFKSLTADESGVPLTVGTQETHMPWVGVQYDLSERIQLRGQVGPRINDDEVDPYVRLSLRRSHIGGDLMLSYERNETTLLGEAGRIEAETYSAAFTHTVGSRFELRVTPAFGKLSQTDYAVDIYRAELMARYRITPYLHLTASYDMYYQEVDFVSGLTEDVARNVVMLGFYLTYPRREDRTTR